MNQDLNCDQVTVEVLFFAKARELSGVNKAIIQTPSLTNSEELLDSLINRFNLQVFQITLCIFKNHNLLLFLIFVFQQISSCLVLAVDENWVESGPLKLNSGSIIAVIPPLSGG